MKQDIDKALQTLRAGGIIVYPTDTIWGIGCDATDAKAVEKIYKLKKRTDSKAMIMLVGSDGQLQQFVKDVPDVAWQLIDAAVNPLTLIYDEPQGVAENLLAPNGSAGFRVTSDPFCSELCRRLRHPIVSTSANISGQKAPKCFDDISEEILDGADYVVEWRREEKSNSAPSNIIKITNSSVVTIIR